MVITFEAFFAVVASPSAFRAALAFAWKQNNCSVVICATFKQVLMEIVKQQFKKKVQHTDTGLW